MKKILYIILFIITALNAGFAQSKTVYVGNIDTEIDLGLVPYIKRVIAEAEKNKADAIIFRVNTFGGRVDAATEIKDAILASKVTTIAFINNRAVSAGALISLSCKNIAMVHGSIMGAATVVDQAGQKQSEKYQAYMRSEMRSTAEKNGRRPDVAEGMVDERVVIPGLVDSTRLVSLTNEEAVKYGMADTTVDDLDGVLAAFGLKGAAVVNVSTNWAEDVVKFLNNPVVSSLLMLIGIIGLFTEIKTPGWGLPGTAGLIALALFFGSSYILELASVLEIALFILGVILLALEIFVIPGFGITGVAGIILIISSLFLALIGHDMPYFDMGLISVALVQLSGTLLAAAVIIYFLVRFLPKTNFFSKLVLANEEKAESGFVSYPSATELVGKEGIALTTLRPAGIAEFDGQKIDVVADWEYIDKGSVIKVLRVEGIKVVVKQVKQE